MSTKNSKTNAKLFGAGAGGVVGTGAGMAIGNIGIALLGTAVGIPAALILAPVGILAGLAIANEID